MKRAQEKWKRVLDRVKSEIDVQTFETWYTPAALVEVTAESLTVAVPNQYFVDHLTKHGDVLLKALKREGILRSRNLLIVVGKNGDT